MVFLHFIFSIILALYIATNLQWYNYKFDRVILKHHKKIWHITYFILPVISYYIFYNQLLYLCIFTVAYLILFIIWYKKLDKPLIFTERVKRLTSIIIFVLFSYEVLCYFSEYCNIYGLFLPLLLAFSISNVLEKIIFLKYKNLAKEKISRMKDLKIIVITASYGKTSIKNYLYQVLNKYFNVYQTPRSVNTLAGIVQDINNNLLYNTNIYVVEAGARERGDILEIIHLLNPHYSILGEVGEQHIEYFKTLDNIINTKMEVLQSNRLIKGFVHKSVPIKKYDNIIRFPENLEIIQSGIDGLKFKIKIEDKDIEFETTLIGKFNAINLSVVIALCNELDIDIEIIKESIKKILPVPNRLQKISVNDKIILDDSFNGNFNGMMEACRIASTYSGNKVIITPGLVESNEKQNIELAKTINKIFDQVIITAELNREIFIKNIDSEKIYILKDKKKMEQILQEQTKEGDLVLFANDAPNFI